MAGKASESDLFEVVAIAVSKHNGASCLHLNVIQTVIVKNLSCDLLSRHARAVLGSVISVIFHTQPSADEQ